MRFQVIRLQLCGKCVPLQVLSKDFAQIYSYLSKIFNILETSISWNTFLLTASNQFKQFLKYFFHKKHVFRAGNYLLRKRKALNVAGGNLIVLIWKKVQSTCNIVLLCYFNHKIYCNIYQQFAQQFQETNHWAMLRKATYKYLKPWKTIGTISTTELNYLPVILAL